MKAKYLFISLALGLGLAIGLLAFLGGWPVSAEAGANRSSLDVLAPNSPRQVCPSGCFYSSIQAAVDDASPGETILVAQGVYTDVYMRDGVTQVVYISKTITILGGYAAPGFAEPPDPDTNATVLDAGGQGRVIYITGDISPTIEGLRLTGGNATGLGGWYMDVGSGVYVISATATISNNQIYSNTGIVNSSGGGLFLHSSDATVSGNSIYSNTTDSCGAGVFVYAGDNATLSGNVIRHNSSNYDGGGVCSEEGFVTLRGNVIHSNTAPDYGGGVYAYHAIDTLVNNAIIDNYAGDEGSGLYINTADYRLSHTTIARNTGGDGSGVHITDDGGASHSLVILTNTILADQTKGVTVTALNTAMVKGVLWSGNGTNIGGAGFISKTSEYTGSPAFAADGYHLTVGSYAINRGVSTGVTDDIDGETRDLPDLGADEYVAVPSVFEVCPSGCTYATIQAAVDAATCGDIIKVAEGTYTDVHQREGITQVVYITKSVTIQGGYAAPGFAEPPNPDVNPTILDAGGQGRVVVIGYSAPTLEGLQLTGGDATGLGGGKWPYDGAGGGIYIYTATATISNCMIYGNVAGTNGWSAGGGVYVWRSTAVLANNEIHDNVASTGTGSGIVGEGGGVSTSEGDAVLTGNSIHDNVGSTIDEGIGGGIYLEYGDDVLRDNIVYGNTASQSDYGQGGGIYLGPSVDAPVLFNTAVFSNSSGITVDSWGAGIAVEWSDAQMIHTTVASNSGGVGNGVYARGSNIAMTNTIIADHAAVGITVTWDGSAIVNGVLWSNNGVNTGGAGPFTITNEYTGTPAFDADGYHLTAGSAAIDRGVIAGVTEDIDGQLRNTPDLGADEWRGEVTVDGTTGGTITYVNGQGLTTTIEVVPGAVTETVLLQFTPIPSTSLPISHGLQYSAIAFDLDAFCDRSYYVYLPLILRNYSDSGARVVPDAGLATFVRGCGIHSTAGSWNPSPCSIAFQKPVTITIYYSDADIAGLPESSLRLYYWTGSYWQDAATTCMPASTYITNTTTNLLQVPICHLSRYGMR
jgi:hypothetical protein